MSLLDRLYAGANDNFAPGNALFREAADEIERLTREHDGAYEKWRVAFEADRVHLAAKANAAEEARSDVAAYAGRLAVTLDRLIEMADASDDACLGTLSTSFVRDMCRATLANNSVNPGASDTRDHEGQTEPKPTQRPGSEISVTGTNSSPAQGSSRVAKWPEDYFVKDAEDITPSRVKPPYVDHQLTPTQIERLLKRGIECEVLTNGMTRIGLAPDELPEGSN